MHPDFFLGDIAKGVVQRFDMTFGGLQKVVIGQVAVDDVAGKRQVRAVELEVEAGFDDFFVLALHRLSQCGQVCLTRRVVLIRQEL